MVWPLIGSHVAAAFVKSDASILNSASSMSGKGMAQSWPIHPALQMHSKYSFVVKLKRANFVLFSTQILTGRN